MTTLLERGTILDSKWQILGNITTKGRGELYLARHIDPDWQVGVVKTLSADYLMELDKDDDEIQTMINRFHREAMAIAQVRHPNVVQVYDEGSTTIAARDAELPVPYVVMEYLPGYTLRSTMPPRGWGENDDHVRSWICDYFLPILDGIETIHERGVVHRDIKPEHVRLDGSNPKVTNFGLVGGAPLQYSSESRHEVDALLYMAPEQFSDPGETDVRGDIYSLGKILYEAVCGRMVESDLKIPLGTASLPNPPTPFLKKLDQVIQNSTAEDKERRIPSVGLLRDRLEKLLETFQLGRELLLSCLCKACHYEMRSENPG